LDALPSGLQRNRCTTLTYQQIDDNRQYGGDDDHEQLEPVEEGNAYKLWLTKVIERGPEQNDKGNEQ
jgi:hypothetical protein